MADTLLMATSDPAYQAAQRRLATLLEVQETNARALETVREQIRKHPTPRSKAAAERRTRRSA